MTKPEPPGSRGSSHSSDRAAWVVPDHIVTSSRMNAPIDRDRMEPQEPSGGRVAEAAALEDAGRPQRPGGEDDLAGPDREAAAVGQAGLDAARPAAVEEDPLARARRARSGRRSARRRPGGRAGRPAWRRAGSRTNTIRSRRSRPRCAGSQRPPSRGPRRRAGSPRPWPARSAGPGRRSPARPPPGRRRTPRRRPRRCRGRVPTRPARVGWTGIEVIQLTVVPPPTTDPARIDTEPSQVAVIP